MKVLIAEDDQKIREGLVEILENEGYQIIEAENGAAAIKLYEETKPDFVCLDIMMPEQSGYDVCRAIRKLDQDTPIIFISAKSEEIDKVLGLELGADDYILKPFGVREVIARIRAVTRRYLRRQSIPTAEQNFAFGPWEVMPQELRAKSAQSTIELSVREVKILSLFAGNPDKVLDRDTIFNHCWGMNYFPNSRTLDQHISKLRKKIASGTENVELIETVHGTGYRFLCPRTPKNNLSDHQV
jgi:DNA-binding response OmpR family regulator